MKRWLLPIVFCILGLSLVAVATNDTNISFESDPYLKFKPAFARSLPIQILVTGVVFTLVVVLFVHLVFTGQYHWPLAPVNYILQLSGVVTLLISLIATLKVVLARTESESSKWPYMVSYISVNVPPTENIPYDADPGEWSTVETATWLLMTATVSVLVQITHIQFLTLLYPSSLERRLIFSLLGPLAVVSAIMQLLSISKSEQLVDMASAIRNVCNATLSLLFTVSLFIWGLLVNRHNAWRTDGGTAVFGLVALTLALASTALNFLYVPREEEYVWLPGLMWAVVLWQSFMGWWWWIGAGSGSMEEIMDEVLRRGHNISARRKMRKEARMSASHEEEVEEENESRDGVTGRRRKTRRSQEEEANERTRSPSSPSRTISADSTISTLPAFLPQVIHNWYAKLRHAHVTAARIQAEERRERIIEIERGRGRLGGSVPWGERRGGRLGAVLGEDEGSVSPEEVEMEDRTKSLRGRRRGLRQTPLDTLTEEEEPKVQAPIPEAKGRLSGSFISRWWQGWRLKDSTSY